MKNLINGFRKQSFSRRYAPHEKNAPLLSMQDITVHYETGMVLDQISFDLAPGSAVAVVGPNGAGKTTSLK